MVVRQRHGARTSEITLLEGDGINAMINEDGTVTLEVYTQRESIILRLNADNTKAQAHIFKTWSQSR